MNCKICGKKLSKNNSTGHCVSTPECRRKNQALRNEEIYFDSVRLTKIKKTCRRCKVVFRLRTNQDERWTLWCDECRLYLTEIENRMKWTTRNIATGGRIRE